MTIVYAACQLTTNCLSIQYGSRVQPSTRVYKVYQQVLIVSIDHKHNKNTTLLTIRGPQECSLFTLRLKLKIILVY